MGLQPRQTMTTRFVVSLSPVCVGAAACVRMMRRGKRGCLWLNLIFHYFTSTAYCWLEYNGKTEPDTHTLWDSFTWKCARQTSKRHFDLGLFYISASCWCRRSTASSRRRLPPLSSTLSISIQPILICAHTPDDVTELYLRWLNILLINWTATTPQIEETQIYVQVWSGLVCAYLYDSLILLLYVYNNRHWLNESRLSLKSAGPQNWDCVWVCAWGWMKCLFYSPINVE